MQIAELCFFNIALPACSQFNICVHVLNIAFPACSQFNICVHVYVRKYWIGNMRGKRYWKSATTCTQILNWEHAGKAILKKAELHVRKSWIGNMRGKQYWKSTTTCTQILNWEHAGKAILKKHNYMYANIELGTCGKSIIEKAQVRFA